MDTARLNEIVGRYPTDTGKILGILEQVQREEGYLPKEILKILALRLEVPLSELYSIATFYSFFTLAALGRHVVTVCMGTACHVKGAPEIVTTLKRLLDVEENEVSKDGKFLLTTEDRTFSLTSARCFGACSMAPVLRIDNKIYGYVTPERIPAILKQYGCEGHDHQGT
jgi:NADH:ubiquinone oxidoreductase subunit E